MLPAKAARIRRRLDLGGQPNSDGRVQLADHRATAIGDRDRTKDFFSVLPDGTAFSMGISSRWIYPA